MRNNFGVAIYKKIMPNPKTTPNWLRFVIILLLTLGIVLRFVSIDQKVYSSDEVRTLLRISGYTGEEFVDQVFDGEIIRVKDLQKYQQPNPEKNLTDTITALAGNPEHPPLYYLMARFWVQGFGNPVAARILAVLISLLAFPCLYWLCLELFDSKLTGWIAIVWTAISPLHVLYSQEARQYSLLIVATLLSSAALLQALRLKTKRIWGIYTVSLALGIYSHLFFTWVAIGHGIYIVITERWRFREKIFPYLVASLAGLLTFIPWILVIISHLDTIEQKTSWASSYQTSLINRVHLWKFNLSLLFVDFDYDFSSKNILLYLILILVIYSIYFLYRYTPKRVSMFVLTLMGVTALAQIFPDVTLGGRRSITPRYLLPSYIGIQLAVAYLLTTKIAVLSTDLWRKRLWQLVLIVLILLGVLSSGVSTQAKGWWTKGLSPNNLQVASIINQANQPLMISDAFYPYILTLSHLLNPEVRLQLVQNPDLLKLQDEFGNVFIYYPSQTLREKIENNPNFKLELVFSEERKHRMWLFKAKKTK